MKNDIMQWTKEVFQLFAWVIIFASILIPNALSFWLPSGF